MTRITNISFLLSLGLPFLMMSACGNQTTQKTENKNKNKAEVKVEQSKENMTKDTTTNTPLKLGVFSMSLNVKDLKTSKEFYENLGFSSMGGDMTQNYLIMKNGNTIIGLFQGMFEGNILTFNPGWDENAKNVDPFDDVRKIQQVVKDQDIELITEADENSSGPASLMFKDPDGNLILIDQHR